jgi:hypothetical protein
MRNTRKRRKNTAQPPVEKISWFEPAIVDLHAIDPLASKHDVEILIEELTTYSRDIKRYEIVSSEGILAIVLQPEYRNLNRYSRPELCRKIEEDIKQAIYHQLRSRI